MGTVSDLGFIRTFTGGDAAKIKKYVGMFLAMAKPSLDQMDHQCADSDWKSLKTTSHSLKSQMKYMGMAQAAEIAQKLETICAEGQGTDQVPHLLADLKNLVLIAIKELEEELAQL
jgi:HPt (histidine-containing phosphotransfer) domain-containing protein